METKNTMQITAVTPLKDILALGMECKRCNHCCTFGTGFLAGDDSKNISRFLKISEDQLEKNCLEKVYMYNKAMFRPKSIRKKGMPYGKCIFLKKDGCSIQDVKPLQCRIGNCSEHGEALSQWFMLNYVIDKDDPEAIRQYACYLESGGRTLKGAELKDIIKDKKKLKDILDFKRLR